MADIYSGVKVVKNFQDINNFYKTGKVKIPKGKILHPNQCVVLKNGAQQSGLGIVRNGYIVRIDSNIGLFGVTPRNKEQVFAMNILNNDDIKLKIITGIEGVGKNYITAAVVLDKIINQKKYNKLILTKTTDEVGKSLGLFPGTADEKFANYLISFRYTFINLLGGTDEYFETMMSKKAIEYIPIQLMRGISFPEKTLIWADEIAGLSPFELRMLGTRLGNDCTLILTGSFQQIDRKAKKEKTGLYNLIHHTNVLDSDLAASIELIKNERSELSKLIAESL